MFGLFLVFLATFQLAYFDKILAALCETYSVFTFWVIFGHVIFRLNWWKRTILNITGWFKNFTHNVLDLYLEFLWKSVLDYIFYRPTFHNLNNILAVVRLRYDFISTWFFCIQSKSF